MKSEIVRCILCDMLPSEYLGGNSLKGAPQHRYSCRICGEVWINVTAVSDNNSHILMGIARERFENGLHPILMFESSEDEFIQKLSYPKSITEKLDRILSYLERKSNHFGKIITLHPYDRPIAYAKNVQEFSFLIEQLKSKKWVEFVSGADGGYKLTIEGWNQLDEMRRSRKSSTQVFVATWFADQMDEPYELGIKKAIDDLHLIPIRMKELSHNDKIDDRIIAEIRKSKFVVADFTGHRGGVYFEAGFGMGLGIPIIWTCRKDHLNDAHFDTRQYNHIEWESPEDLYQKLKDRIEATIII